ncbi:MAG TPA: DNA-binding response regulator [Cytophagales bacterium]|nr:DNA-binding response regulator [Cytophagales bacterium]HAA23867.1 DNA-binding response regulator [Cytophagales bacterium]HAP64453.1 DNA-binding response regulator [Cytophagales bacterium]
MMNIVIIEDNPAAARHLKSLLDDEIPGWTLVGEADSIVGGLAVLEGQTPDLAFLDVELKDGLSFDLLRQLSSIEFPIVFTTGHEQYALQAIKFSAIDYLLKPIDEDELAEAIEKVEADTQEGNVATKMSALLHNARSGPSNPLEGKLILKDKYGIQMVSVGDIVRLEASGSYTEFFIREQKPLLISKGLKEYSQLLPETLFFRCHQSHLINLHYLRRYDKREGDVLQLEGGDQVPLASRKKEQLMRLLGN